MTISPNILTEEQENFVFEFEKEIQQEIDKFAYDSYYAMKM